MSEDYEGEEKYGFTNGTITLIYEDADGQEYTQETEISTMISEPVITVSNNDEEEEQQEKAGQWWISIVIGVVIIAGLATYIIIRKARTNGEQLQRYPSGRLGCRYKRNDIFDRNRRF